MNYRVGCQFSEKKVKKPIKSGGERENTQLVLDLAEKVTISSILIDSQLDLAVHEEPLFSDWGLI